MSDNHGGALRPIRLHLDTSDYAAMHVAPHGSPNAEIRDKLKEMVRSGHLEIGLSYHVLFEFVQKATPQYREDRLALAQLLRELCGHNAFPHPIDLGKGYSFSNDGVWFPRSELAFFDVENLIKDLISTEVQNLPRGKRRALSKRTNFIKWARDNPSRLDVLITAQPWSLVLQQRFIKPGHLKRYIFGETSRVEANRELLSCVVDPATMYETWFEHSDGENPLAVIGEQLTKVEGAARQPVNARHRHHVAGGEGVEQLQQLPSVRPRTVCLLTVNLPKPNGSSPNLRGDAPIRMDSLCHYLEIPPVGTNTLAALLRVRS